MKLLDFELSKPSFAIELVGLGFVWDLHNSGDFLGLELRANNNTAIMRWTVGGYSTASYLGCELVFRNLKLIIVSERDPELPLSEDTCISGISKIVPDGGTKPEYRTRKHWNADDPFHLFFDFQSRRTIEIDAETVELIGIVKTT
jgi:hypothetical protein